MGNVDFLQELLRLDTTNPPGNEGPAGELLRGRLDAAGFETRIEKSPAGRPNLIARLPGPTDRPALVLLSHTDVVPVEEEHWTHDPFGGEIADGFVWGRGALDMKGIGALHCLAAEAASRSGKDIDRELIVCAVADEETGGKEGARWLVEEHPDLVGFADGRTPPDVLGEGSFGLSEIFDRPFMPIVLGEKKAAWIELTATGSPGHGSLPPTDQAPVNLVRAVEAISGFGTPRVHPVMQEQFRIMAESSGGPRAKVLAALASGRGDIVARLLWKPLRATGALGSVLADTVTPTQLDAGYKQNVVPGQAKASFDCRLLPDTNVDDFLRALRRKTEKHNTSIELTTSHEGPVSSKTPLFDVMERASESLPSNPVVVPSLTPGFTDLRFFRGKGASGYGWVPMVITPELLSTIHGHDERVPIVEFESGVEAMTRVVSRAVTGSG